MYIDTRDNIIAERQAPKARKENQNMISYTERSNASRKGKASQYSFHVAKIENGKERLIVHSFKTLKAATKKCERYNANVQNFFAYTGLKPYYHYEVVID